MDDLTLQQLIFVNVLGMQYHPRNEIYPDPDEMIKSHYGTYPSKTDTYVIQQAIRVSKLAVQQFNEDFNSCQQ